MIRTIEAEIDADGQVHLKTPLQLAHTCRALVIIEEEALAPDDALWSEEALAKDWNRPEEDAAWSHLQQAR